MGTTYNVSFEGGESTYLQTSIDSLLIAINAIVSTYKPDALITAINRGSDSLYADLKIVENADTTVFTFPCNPHFSENFYASRKISKTTNNLFDPTVMPLVNYWGFGYSQKKPVTTIDSSEITNMLKTVGMSKWSMIQIDELCILKKPNNAELDFSAIAKGYAVDQISQYLVDRDISNHLVEIGGEVKASGHNSKGENWTIGLNKPKSDASLTDFQALVSLSDIALASSGNYRNFYEVNGIKYGHEINPLTGYPQITDILGTSVITSNCMTADAYATGFMIMSIDEAMQLAESIEGLEAIFFYGTEDGKISQRMTSNFSQHLLQKD